MVACQKIKVIKAGMHLPGKVSQIRYNSTCWSYLRNTDFRPAWSLSCRATTLYHHILFSELFFKIVCVYFFNCMCSCLKFYVLVFIFVCAGSPLLCMAFLSLQEQGCPPAAELGCSRQWLLLSRIMGSRVQAPLWWCMAWAAHGMWHLPGPGVEPVSLALAGEFLTTRPPGKPHQVLKENKSQRMVNSF